jgi:hypothetical protein
MLLILGLCRVSKPSIVVALQKGSARKLFLYSHVLSLEAESGSHLKDVLGTAVNDLNSR